jgi:hypothetical protein
MRMERRSRSTLGVRRAHGPFENRLVEVSGVKIAINVTRSVKPQNFAQN